MRSLKIILFLTLTLFFFVKNSNSQTQNWKDGRKKAIKILKDFPTSKQIMSSKFSPKLKLQLKNLRVGLQMVSKFPNQPSNSLLKKTSRNFGDVKALYEGIKVVYLNDAPSVTTVECISVYDKCMNAIGCTYSFPCICCLPCEFEFVACMGSMLKRGMNSASQTNTHTVNPH